MQKNRITTGILYISAVFLITACGGSSDNGAIAPPPAPITNRAPSFTSTNTVSLVENSTDLVITLTATDPDGDTLQYAVTGGLDESQFSVNSSNGELKFVNIPIFAAPLDTDKDNVYLVTVSADDGNTNVITQDLQITVTSTTIIAAEASRFLTQATFGPNFERINSLMNESYVDWIDAQMQLPPSRTVEYAESQGWVNAPLLTNSLGRQSAILNLHLRAEDQLRQRMAYALSQIFVVSNQSGIAIEERPLFFLDYYDILVDNAFGNYRELLETITINDVMGSYLNTMLNRKRDVAAGVLRPDENYAREVMQLFSIGLFELNIDGTQKLNAQGKPIPTYGLDTIENFARVFTGWNYQSDQTTEFYNLGLPPDTRPMRSWDDFHDMDEKTLLNGTVLQAGQTAVQDLEQALDNLFEHPNVGPFIGKQLIQRFVTSNPSPEYVARVARVFNDNGSGVRGDLGAVIRTILLDDEARNGHINMPNKFGKYKEPYIRLIALWRAFDSERVDATNIFDSYVKSWLNRLKQFPLESPSVFNFYQNDFSPIGELGDRQLLAPEAQLLDSESVVSMASTFAEFTLRQHDEIPPGQVLGGGATINLQTQDFQDLVSQDFMRSEDLVDRLDLLLLAGSMPDEMREILLSVHNQTDYTVEEKWEVVIDLTNIIVQSPYYHLQR